MAEVLRRAKFIVGLDIGTVHSAFAFTIAGKQPRIYSFYDWPNPDGQPCSPKTLCAIYYGPGDGTTAQVKSWGFAARHDYERDLNALRGRPGVDMPELGAFGTYFEDFTRHLASEGARQSSAIELKEGFTVTQVITAFLRKMAAFVLQYLSDWDLQNGWCVYPTMEDIQWSVAVPSNWDNHAKKLLELCVERAGLVRSANSPGGSPHLLSIVSNLEAAAYHCLHCDFDHAPEFKAGDQLVMAHIGIKTTDIVVQEVISAGKFSYRTKEVAASFGVCGGEMQVDDEFNMLMFSKIPLLKLYLRESSRTMRDTSKHTLEEIKWVFDREANIRGTTMYDVAVPSELAAEWQRFHEAYDNFLPQFMYDTVELTYAEIETVFQPLLDQIVTSVADQLLTTPAVKAIVVVGELSGSPYLLTEMKTRLNSLQTVAIMSRPNPAAAACQGAVMLAFHQATTPALEGDAQLLENGPTSSSHDDSIVAESSSREFSQPVPAHGSTSSSSWSSSSSGGASEPFTWRTQEPSNSLAEDVVGKNTSGQVILSPPNPATAVPQEAVVEAIDEVTTSALKGGAQLLENESASSSHGNGIAVESISKEFSQPVPALGATSWSSSSSSGGSEPVPVYKPSHFLAEDVVKKYTWDQVLHLTNGPTSRLLGEGGFSKVYLGKLENGRKVAVKILHPASRQGMPETFLNEVNLLKRVNHVNLVRLLGYCEDEQQVLVYEFAEEGSLWDHLHGEKTRLNDWKQRLSIALQAACGLEYLHTLCTPRIIHRDLKSENILLTKTMVAKVGDFGLSRLGADEHNNSKSHFTTQVIGTRGYLDPEYHMTGQLRRSSDVYSFGIVLLEIITGRKPIPDIRDSKSFISNWMEKTYGSGGSRAVKAVADSAFGRHFEPRAMKLVINLALSCTKPSRENRPEMPEVVGVLRQAQALELQEKKSWIPFL